VAEWWTPTPTLAEVIEQFRPLTIPGGRDRGYIALAASREIGYIQSYVVKDSGDGWWPGEQDPGARGIDQFLADETQLGRRIGTRMIRSFVAQLFADPAVTRIQADPSLHNTRAIRCYEKADFRRVGEVDTPDGRALLMRCGRPVRRGPCRIDPLSPSTATEVAHGCWQVAPDLARLPRGPRARSGGAVCLSGLSVWWR
jgi:RimJ/RimL family protein N-acetyltransferase